MPQELYWLAAGVVLTIVAEAALIIGFFTVGVREALRKRR